MKEFLVRNLFQGLTLFTKYSLTIKKLWVWYHFLNPGIFSLDCSRFFQSWKVLKTTHKVSILSSCSTLNWKTPNTKPNRIRIESKQFPWNVGQVVKASRPCTLCQPYDCCVWRMASRPGLEGQQHTLAPDTPSRTWPHAGLPMHWEEWTI